MDLNRYDCAVPQHRDTLVADIEKAINGECGAIACYQKLIEAASCDEEREVIQEIRRDEIRHYREFSQIHAAITGTTYRPRITEECPADFLEGLRAAFKDEQNTVDFYREVADKAEDSFIAERFRRAAADEQHHAVWFSFFYFNHRCR
ncbi:MAG TPA: ferritin-like domain-containing protein [Bacillota bacterium]|nr:ferritin-like domain-containing protein [Bacillota bacterium]